MLYAQCPVRDTLEWVAKDKLIFSWDKYISPELIAVTPLKEIIIMCQAHGVIHLVC